MNTLTGNEPAFSKAAFYHPDGGADSPQEGLTIRQHFAAMAMQGLLSSSDAWASKSDMPELAKRSLYAADALIEELNKPKP